MICSIDDKKCSIDDKNQQILEDAEDDDENIESVPTMVATPLEHQVSLSEDSRTLDEKSIVRRAYDLIDRTAERIRRPPATSQQTRSERARSIDAELSSPFESDVALAPVVARAKAKAASAYFTNGGRKREQLEPGVEYVRCRAPGLDSSFYLRLMRIHNFRRAIVDDSQHQQTGHPETAEVETLSPKQSVPSHCSRLRKYRMLLYCAGVTVCILIAGGVTIALTANRGESANTLRRPDEPTRFSPFTTDCETMSHQLQPNIWSQCNCTGTISLVAPDIAERYDNLSKTFVNSVLVGFNESLHSCRPQNQALVWLASGDGATNPSRMRQRFTFAFLFSLWDGTRWTVSDKWLSSADECTWFGLNCNDEGLVVNITFSDYNVLVDLPPIASLLGSLESLVIEYASIQGNKLPSELGLLTNLLELSLDLSGLNGTIPPELFDLGEKLQSLSIFKSSLSGTIPTLIGKLTRLQTFYLDASSSLTGSIPNELGLCTNLVNLLISDINFIGTIPSTLGSLSVLESLQLFGNSLTGTIPTDLARCSALYAFLVGGNYLTGFVPTEFAYLHSLSYMDVLGTRLRVPLAVCQHFALFGPKDCTGCNC